MPEYIEREALIARLDEHIRCCNEGEQSYWYLSVARDIVASAPAVDAEPVAHGEWIEKNTGAYGRRQKFCSACGEHSSLVKARPRCPNCGARMDMEDEQ